MKDLVPLSNVSIVNNFVWESSTAYKDASVSVAFSSAFQIKSYMYVYIIFIFSSVFVYDNATNQITGDANDVVMRHKRVIKHIITKGIIHSLRNGLSFGIWVLTKLHLKRVQNATLTMV